MEKNDKINLMIDKRWKEIPPILCCNKTRARPNKSETYLFYACFYIFMHVFGKLLSILRHL